MKPRSGTSPVLWVVLLGLVLGLAGVGLRAYVAATLTADAGVQTAFLDLALRDRARFLADTLQPAAREDHWPSNLADQLTRNHADFNRDIFLQVFGRDGQLVAASANAPAGVGPLDLEAASRRPLTWSTAELPVAGRGLVRLVTYPVYEGVPTDATARLIAFARAGVPLPNASRALARFTWASAAGLLALWATLVWVVRSLSAREAERLRLEAEEIRSSQIRFVADASHELATPLAVLKGEIEIAMRRERTPEEYRAALASCREEIERLARISENLLALATADSGQPLIHPAPCDVSEVVRRVHARFGRTAAEKGVRLSCKSPAELPWKADALAIEQVLGNLVSNAIRHTPAGDEVLLEVFREGSSHVFRVADTGEGIPPAHVPKLFQRFHRVDKARSRLGGGAGLGLAIVRTLVEAHGGTVSVESVLGKGSAFTCRFPDSAG